MTIDDFIEKIDNGSLQTSHEKEIKIMKSAKIIDEDGYLDEHFFSDETIATNRKNKKVFI